MNKLVPVLHLLRPSSPAAVLRAVAFVVVYAVNASVFAGPLSHVPVEGFKTVTPLVAHSNAALAVDSVTAVVGVCATLNHCRPDVILRRSPGHAVGGLRFASDAAATSGFLGVKAPGTSYMPVAAITKTFPVSVVPVVFVGDSLNNEFPVSLAFEPSPLGFRNALHLVAAARSSVPTTQGGCSRKGLVAALALTNPSHMLASVFTATDYSESPESLASKINESAHVTNPYAKQNTGIVTRGMPLSPR